MCNVYQELNVDDSWQIEIGIGHGDGEATFVHLNYSISLQDHRTTAVMQMNCSTNPLNVQSFLKYTILKNNSINRQTIK